MGRVANQVTNSAMQRIKELQASPIKSLKADSSRFQARKFSGAVESTGFNTDKLKQAEDSLRTVMYLSCWGPN